MRNLLFYILVVLIFDQILITSCNMQKHVQSETHSVDSSYLKSVQDSVRVLKSENSHLQSEVSQLQYAGVQFDTLFQLQHDTLTNTITITKEGDITARGKILSAYVSKSFMQKVISDKDNRIDSFAKALDTEKKNIKTVVQTKELTKIVKTPFPWVWIVVMFVLGGFIWDRSKPFILKLLKL